VTDFDVGLPPWERSETCLCGRQAVAWLGTVGYCVEHHEDAVGAIWQSVALRGVGVAEVGGEVAVDGSTMLTCSSCQAEWCGFEGEPCVWCQRRRESIVEDQRRVLLRDSVPDPADVDAVNAWVARVAVAVAAGYVTADEARAATERLI